MDVYNYQENLESDRLITRFLTRNDIPIWADFFKDPEAIELLSISGNISNEERSEQWLQKQLGRYASNTYGLQVLLDKKTNEFIGQCGLLLQEVDGIKELEVGYHVFKKYWGQGYAPEAARMFMDYAFENKLSDSIISIIDVRNLRSQRVAEKNGLTREKQTQWSELDVFIYRFWG